MQRSHQRRWPAIVAMIAVSVFAVAAIMAAFQLSHRRDITMAEFRSDVWAIVQLDREWVQLATAVERRARGGGAETSDSLMLQYDITWSRFPILMELERGTPSRVYRLIGDEISAQFERLKAMEPAIRRLAGGDTSDLRALREELALGAAALQQVMGTVLVQEGYLTNRDHLQRKQDQIVASFGVMVAAVAVLILLLVQRGRDAARAAAFASEAEARLRDAIESSSEGFLITNAEGRVVIANRRFREIYPWADEPLQSGNAVLSDLIAAAFRAGKVVTEEGVEAALTERLRQLETPREPFEQDLADGRTLLVAERRTQDGGIVSIRTDITALKRQQRLLEERVAAMNAARDGIAICDAAGNFTYMNESHARLFGSAPAAEYVGRHWTTLYLPDEAARIAAAAFPALRDAGHWSDEAWGLRDGVCLFPQEVMLTALPGGGLICVTRDITQRKQEERERSELKEQFFHAQKLEALGRLAGGVAHDFNNVLAAILGYAEFLVDDLEEGSDQRGFAANILQSGQRAKELVKQILAYSRNSTSSIEDVAVAPVVQEVGAMLRATLPSNIEFALNEPSPDDVLRSNTTQVSQVLMNLCVNAMDAIGKRPGRITLDCGPIDIDGLRAEGLAKRWGETGRRMRYEIDRRDDGTVTVWVNVLDPHLSWYRFVVEDDGPGIPVDVLDRIFEPFFTTKDIGKGSGLGLAAVHGIVTAHGGGITLTTRPGNGTRFEIFLPRADRNAQAVAGPDAAVLLPPPATRPVLVVDDEPYVREVMVMRLARAGLEAFPAADAAEALAIADRHQDAFSVVITDHSMPGLSGLDLARQLRKRSPGLPIFLCTGHLDDASEVSSHSGVVDGVLSKPVHDADLQQALRSVLGAAAVRSPAPA